MSKKGALCLSPTQFKQLVKVCKAIVQSQEGGGYPPTRGGMDDYFREMYDVPIYIKPSAQTGAGV